MLDNIPGNPSEKEKKTKAFEQKLTLNINHYPVFENIRNILQELHLLST